MCCLFVPISWLEVRSGGSVVVGRSRVAVPSCSVSRSVGLLTLAWAPRLPMRPTLHPRDPLPSQASAEFVLLLIPEGSDSRYCLASPFPLSKAGSWLPCPKCSLSSDPRPATLGSFVSFLSLKLVPRQSPGRPLRAVPSFLIQAFLCSNPCSDLQEGPRIAPQSLPDVVFALAFVFVCSFLLPEVNCVNICLYVCPPH